MLKKWVLFISSRYIRVGRQNRKVSPGLLSAGGIAVGVMALVTVISVMNGFQLGFIEDILEISSYHIRVSGIDSNAGDRLSDISGIKSVVPFYETKTLISGPYNIEPCLVKGVPENAGGLDPEFFKQLNIFRGSFEPEVSSSVVLGRLLALKLGLSIGDTVSVVALDGDTFRNLRPETNEFVITGLFHSGYDDFDTGMVLTSEKSLLNIDSGAELKYGIKLENRFKDRKAAAEIIRLEGVTPGNVVTWREYNRAFFSALRLEKTVMFILLGLIFLVVSFGIFNSTRRTIAEKQEEIGILRAIGSTPLQIRQIFILDGLIIGITGGIIGILLGFAITVNVNEIMMILSLNSSFLINIPVRIIPREVIIIFVFAVLFCSFSALVASARISTITPQEVLRYE